MAVKVTVVNRNTSRVSVQGNQRKTIRTVNVFPDLGTVGSLDALSDVTITNPANNQTLVYDSATGQFVNNELPVINGGEF